YLSFEKIAIFSEIKLEQLKVSTKKRSYKLPVLLLYNFYDLFFKYFKLTNSKITTFRILN
ncbi:MAG: hypothetical protein AAFO95_08800, partial [Cyanobacteria bacterium J06600_6]